MRVTRLVAEELFGKTLVDDRSSAMVHELSQRLNAFTCDSDRMLTDVSDLVTHLLTGLKSPWSTSSNPIAGKLQLTTPKSGSYQLKRSSTVEGSRLTISRTNQLPNDQSASDQRAHDQRASEGINDWHQGVEPSILATIFCNPHDDDHALVNLLSPEVAASFNRLTSKQLSSASRDTEWQQTTLSTNRELLSRRDELAALIEKSLGERRHESVALENRLADLEAIENEQLTQLESLRSRLAVVDAELNEEETRARYAHLNQVALDAEGRHAADDWEPRIEDLDGQIGRWRATLSELESRLARVRSELAQVHPDDATPELPLSDQRASIAVAQRLIADLESEVARFARSNDSPLCLCKEAHPRLNPLVETLGRHINRLAELVSQQDRALRAQELIDESERIERSQTEIRQQLEKLLERRQTLWRTSRSRVEKPLFEYDLPIDHDALQQRHAALSLELEQLEATLFQLRQERDRLIQQRTDLLNQADLRNWRIELETLQTRIAEGRFAQSITATGGVATLRASDLLAKLSDGELTQLRLVAGGREVSITDRRGAVINQSSLGTEHRRLVVWALRLALVDSCVNAGVSIPLILNAPFKNLSDRHAANLAMTLDDLQNRGRQVILFTQRREALDRIRSLGGSIHVLGQLVKAKPQPAPPVPIKTPKPRVETITKTLTETLPLLELSDSVEKFPVPIKNRAAAFSRARIRTVGELLEADPSDVADEISIDGISAELVSLWQTHLCLVCFVPGLTFQQAKYLSDCEILSVDDLATVDVDQLRSRLSKLGVSSEHLASLSGWIEHAYEGSQRWQRSSAYRSWSQNRSERSSRIHQNSQRRNRSEKGTRNERRGERLSDGEHRNGSRSERSSSRSGSSRSSSKSRSSSSSQRSSSRSSSKQSKGLRFYLEIDSPVVDAPSIGNKRAAQLKSHGVITVSDLLAIDPQWLAEQLDDSRVDSAKIVAWQHQAGLICRVPGLRGHDAQVLVGCGFTTPEDISSMKPAELLEFVDPFCDSSEGQRALRGSQRPDLAEVKDWIEGARQNRVLGAV